MRILASVTAGLLSVTLLAQPAPPKAHGKFNFSSLPPLVQKVVKASKAAHYSGERIVTFKREDERRSHHEIVLRDGARTRIEFPGDSDFRGQVVVENATERRHYFPDKNEIHILPPRGEETARRLIGLIVRGKDRGVSTRETGGGEVAGVATRLLSIIDGSNNVMQELWIDPRSGVILQRKVYDRTGTLTGGFTFVRVNFSPKIDQSDFIIQRKGAVVVTPYDMAKKLANEAGLSLRTLPPSLGYRLEAAWLHRRGTPTVLMQAYVGKGGRFMLFQSSGPLDPGRMNRGAPKDASVYVWTMGGETFALVGDLPRMKLEELASHLRDS